MTISYFRRFSAFLIGLCFFIAFTHVRTAFAQGAISPLAGTPPPAFTPKDAVWPWEGSDLRNDPSITYGRLPNGMRYAIKPNKLPENGVVLRFRLKAGSRYERDDQRGLSHFIEHMAFNGSTNIPEGELTKMMERLGSSFGSDVNAHVNVNEAMYKLDLPRADGGRLETALKIFRETADRLLLEEAAVKREMGVVLSELNDGETPYRRVGRASTSFMRPDDLLTKREPIGERGIIEGATGAKLREFYETWYRPDRAILVISGDVDVEATKALIMTAFSDWTPKTLVMPPEPDNGTWPQATLRAQIQVEPDLPTALSVTAMRPDEFDYGDLDTAASRKWWLLHGLAGDIFQRRLATMQLVDNPPASNIGFDHNYRDNGWTSTLSISPRGDDWRRALSATIVELRQAMAGGFSAAEINEAIKERRLGYDRAIAEASTRRTLTFANSIMSSLANDNVIDTPQDWKALFEDVVGLATPERLQEAFSWWWTNVDPAIVLLTKAPLAGGEETLKAAWREAMSAPLPPRTPYVRARYQPLDLGPAGRLVSTQVRRNPEATIARFANGVTFAFKQTNFTADRVSIAVTYGAGSLAFPLDDLYWSLYAEATWSGDGVGNLTRDQMITALAGRSTSLARVDLNQVTTSLVAGPAKADVLEQLQVMISQVREPRLGPRAANLQRDQLRAGWDSIPLTPSGTFSINSGSFYYQGLPIFTVPTLDSFLQNNDEEGKHRLKTILENAPINVTIVGDMTFEAARDAVAQTFGALPLRRGLAPGYERLAPWSDLPAGGAPRILLHKGQQNQAIISVSWATPGLRNQLKAGELYVLGQILQLRLTARVREAAGEAYSPSGSFSPETVVDKGRLSAFASVTPEHVATVNNMIDEIARDLATSGPSHDELQRVIGPLIEGEMRSRQSNQHWIGKLFSYGLPRPPSDTVRNPLTDTRSFERRYRAITPAKLKRLAARYMVPANAIRVQVLPTPPSPASVPAPATALPIG
jgi:zinc protease